MVAAIVSVMHFHDVQALDMVDNSLLTPQQHHYRRKIVIDNNRAYALTFGGRIDIYNLSDPLYPKMLGYVSTPELGTSDFDVSGDYLYLFDYDYALSEPGFEGMIYVFDVSDASKPVQLAKFVGFGRPYTIRVDRQYLHLWHVLENEPDTIEIYDISDQYHVRYVSSYGPGADLYLHIADERSYLLESGGINVYDISDVTNPHSIGTDALLDITQGATEFTVDSHFLYQTSEIPQDDGTHKCGIRIIDIQNLEVPKLLDSTEVVGLCNVSPVVEGDRLYISIWQKEEPVDPGSSIFEIVVIDISDPTSIKEWARYKPPPAAERVELHVGVSAPCIYIIGTYDDVLTTICTTLAPQVTVTPTATPTITSTSTATRSPTPISLYLPLLQIK